MAITPELLEAASHDSWATLNNGNPLRSVAAMRASAPEILEQHKRNIKALFENELDPERAIRSMTQGRQGLEDCTETSKAFHRRLSAYLKAWAKSKNVK